jgi:hypothetical protein
MSSELLPVTGRQSGRAPTWIWKKAHEQRRPDREANPGAGGRAVSEPAVKKKKRTLIEPGRFSVISLLFFVPGGVTLRETGGTDHGF